MNRLNSQFPEQDFEQEPNAAPGIRSQRQYAEIQRRLNPPGHPSEKQFQAQVVDLARTAGWKCYHTFLSTRSSPGYPDLTLVHPDGILIFAELKVGKNKPSVEQQVWLDLLGVVCLDYVKAFVWTPQDWPEIQQELVTRYR